MFTRKDFTVLLVLVLYLCRLSQVRLILYTLYAFQTVAAIAACVLHLMRFAANSDGAQQSSSSSASAGTAFTAALTSPKLVACLCRHACSSMAASACTAVELRSYCEALLDCLKLVQQQSGRSVSTDREMGATSRLSSASSSLLLVPDTYPQQLVQSTID